MIWGESLRAVLKDFDGKPHAYGTADCIQFVSAYVKNRTGINHAAKFQYDSEFSALKLASQHGRIEGLIESCLGASKLDPQPGDVVLCHFENWRIPGVNAGYTVWVFTEKGLGRLTLPSIICAWSV